MSRDELLALCHPIVVPIIDRQQQILRSRYGLLTTVLETYRDEAAQQAAWLKGRNNAGEVIDPKAVVTEARAGQSWHGVRYRTGKPCSFAWHLGVDGDATRDGTQVLGYGNMTLELPGAGKLLVDLDGRPPLDEMGPGHLILSAVGLVGRACGATWGGPWRSRDWLHFEYHPELISSWSSIGATLTQVQAIMRDQGDIPAVRT